MLVLARKLGEGITIGDHIEVTVITVRGQQVKLGIQAPEGISIYRNEIYRKILDENRKAATSQHDKTNPPSYAPIATQKPKVLHFPSGILGFSDSKDFMIFDHDQNPNFKWLQAVEDASLSFIVMDPLSIMPHYEPEIPGEELAELGIQNPEHIALIVFVTISHDHPANMTANLQGPVMINMENLLAKQVISHRDRYHTQHSLAQHISLVESCDN